MLTRISLSLALILSLAYCGGSSNDNSTSNTGDGSGGGSPSPQFNILMMGNSHTTPIPPLLKKIFNQTQASVSVDIVLAPGNMYLFDRMNDQANLDLLKQGDWTHVVMQALKYSTSGTISYPTLGAEYFITQTNNQGAIPILYPEHPRKGNTWESSYLFELHTSIAVEYPACVAAIGFVWEDFMAKSTLNLHATDGNHASGAGAFLTALILYQIITESNVADLDYITDVGVDPDDQALMRASVADILTSYDPCLYYS